MKIRKICGDILFCLTLISPVLAFEIACNVGESSIFSILGMVRYSWIMFLFAPIAILSIVFGLKLKHSNQKHKKNLVVAYICLPLLLIFGSYRFIFSGISYDVDKIANVANKTNIELPTEIKVATETQIAPSEYNYYLSYVKIVDKADKEAFERTIGQNKLWKNTLDTYINGLLPMTVQVEMNTFDAFVFYNYSTGEYNTRPPIGQYSCVFIAYDYEAQRLIVIDNYVVNVA